MLHFIDTWIPGKITTFHWKPQWKWKQMKIKSLQLICPQCLSVSTSDVYKFPIERRRHTNKFHQFTARNLFQSGFEIQIECNVHGCDCFRSSLHRKQHLKLANEKICLYTINHSIGTNFFIIGMIELCLYAWRNEMSLIYRISQQNGQYKTVFSTATRFLPDAMPMVILT